MNVSETQPIRTRIAPSPTGIAHVGTAWMSMFDLALARQSKGQFLVRIEDTDRTRFVEGAEEKIYEAFKWLGIEYDEGGEKGGPYAPYHQSERLETYHQYMRELIAKKAAYYCFCTPARLEQMRNEQQKNKQLPKYDGHCRHLRQEEVELKMAAGEKWVVRLKAPEEGVISWEDLIRGHVEFSAHEVDDAVLIKSDGYPTYHFAVVVDDHLMKITHVLRGEEWISSTPKHLLLYQAFEWEAPFLAHMPLIRNEDKSKLSKRKNDVSILSYRDKGYLPEALLNFIALLGWSHPDKKEIFSFTEFLEVMSLDRIQKTGPVFDINKLNWMNGMYIRAMARPELLNRLEPFLPADFPREKMEKLLDLVTERLVTLADIESLTAFFYRPIVIESGTLIKKSSSAEVLEQLSATKEVLESISDWSTAQLEEKIRRLQDEKQYKKSQYFMMLRLTVTGQSATPPLFETMTVLGKDVSLERVNAALGLLSRA